MYRILQMDTTKYMNEAKQLLGTIKSTSDNVKKCMRLSMFEMKWAKVVDPFVLESDDNDIYEIWSDILYNINNISKAFTKEEEKRWIQIVIRSTQIKSKKLRKVPQHIFLHLSIQIQYDFS